MGESRARAIRGAAWIRYWTPFLETRRLTVATRIGGPGDWFGDGANSFVSTPFGIFTIALSSVNRRATSAISSLVATTASANEKARRRQSRGNGLVADESSVPNPCSVTIKGLPRTLASAPATAEHIAV